MKIISLQVPDDMVSLIEQWASHIPEMEVVSSQDSKEYELSEMNRKMALALQTMKHNGALRYGYDYTWIMAAIGDGAVRGISAFKSPQSFMNYLKILEVEHIPSRTTLSTWFGKVFGTYPDWEFTDSPDPQEIQRRKNVVKQLISALNKASKPID